MSDCLIGYTGFVGRNLQLSKKYSHLYNSQNIHKIKGRVFDTIVCAGVPAEKWKANKEPEADWTNIDWLLTNLREVKTNRFILISTVDVYSSPNGVTEDSPIDTGQLSPYGKHRFEVERFVREHFAQYNIIRLPGLFGKGLKKNIIYDLLNNNQIDKIHTEAVYQFYDLSRLNQDIHTIVNSGVETMNMATEPTSVSEIAQYAFGIDFQNKPSYTPPIYDFQTSNAAIFNRQGKYILQKDEVLSSIKQFVTDSGYGH